MRRQLERKGEDSPGKSRDARRRRAPSAQKIRLKDRTWLHFRNANLTG